jgi:hypothetical protein
MIQHRSGSRYFLLNNYFDCLVPCIRTFWLPYLIGSMENSLANRIIKLVFMQIFCISLSPSTLAQQDDLPSATDAKEYIEEIVVTGESQKHQLRLQMLGAERAAYDLFNQFNDEKRFDIYCSVQTPTGSRIQSEEQHCQPNFEIEALRSHSRDYLESLRLLYDLYSPDKNAVITSQPAEVLIASQQEAYRKKMKQVAEDHPEFLEALIEYSKLKAQYEAAK